MAPISNSIIVGTKRSGRALVRYVILSNRILGMVEHPLFSIVASRKDKVFLFGGHAFSGEKRQQLVMKWERK